MGDANDGIGWLLQCGISYLFDPDIEGAVKDSCTHRLLSPFSHLPLNHEERRARGRVVETVPERATRHAHITSPFHRVHTSLLGEGDVPGRDSPHREALSLLVAARSSLRRHASTELAAH